MAAVALVGIMIVLAWTRDGRAPQALVDQPGAETPGAPAIEPAMAMASGESSKAAVAETLVDNDQRHAAQPKSFPLRLLVLDESGHPLSQATVSWTALPDENLGASGQASVEQILAVLQSSSFGQTDDEGLVVFDEGPAPSARETSVLWASHAGYHANAITLEAGSDWHGANLSCRLRAARTLQAHVKVAKQEVLTDLRVVQAGLSLSDLRIMDRTNPWFGDGDGLAALPAEVLRCFVRSYACDDRGFVNISRSAVPSQLIALADGRCSGPRVSRADDESVEFSLARELQAQGKVNSPVVDYMPEDARVECRWKAGLDEQVLGEFAVSHVGQWGPVTIPRREQGDYIFRLLGGDFIPQEKKVAAVGVGARLEVTFDGVYGLTQAIEVHSAEGAAVQGARVEAVWQVETGWERSRGWSDDMGTALLPGCPNVSAWIQISKPGFVRLSQGGIFLVHDWPEKFTLEVAGRVEGHVLHDGDPVQNFQVFSWDESPVYRVVHPFSNRKDGSFVLDRVPLGQLSLLASSPEYPEGEAVTLNLIAGEPASVEFELEVGGRGVGRVVDSITGQPIGGATVELLSQFSGRPLGGRGMTVPVDGDGYFEVSGVRTDLPLIRAMAAGRIQADSAGRLGTDGKVHFGTIPLAVRQDLLVRVHSDEPLAEHELFFDSYGAFSISFLEIPASGRLLVPDVAPGNHMAELIFPNGRTLVQSVWLRPGTEWLVEFDHNPLETLDVLPVLSKAQSLPGQASLHAQFRTSSGALVTLNVPVEGSDAPTHLTHIPSGDVLLFMTADGDYLQRLASKQLILGPDRSKVVELHFGGHSIAVTAVDSEGTRLEEAVVILDSAVPGDLFNEAVSMPAGGEFVLDAIPVDELLVTVRNSKLGLGFERVSMKSDETTAVEVQVGGADLQVHVSDGAQVVAGVDVRLIPAGVVTAGFLGKTDEEGLWTFEGIPDRHYSLSLERYGYWPVRHEIDFHGQDSIPLAIRQRGDLELSLTLSNTQKVAQQSLSLRSLTDHKSIQEWIDERLLSTSAVQLVSNDEGHCFVHGIPRGTYSWDVQGPDGTRASGECEVPGGGVGQLSIVLSVP